MLRNAKLLGRTALGFLVGMAACQQDELLRPPSLVPVDPLFTRFVSVGNSITAGFSAGGISDTTQQRAYAVLVARQMRTPFYIPSMNVPGCPAPFTNVFTQTRLSPIPCLLRKFDPVPPPFISNVAVPGAEVMDAVANIDTASNANALTIFFLGGLTQMQMLQRARPTFVSVWIGNNDALGAATNMANAGDSTLLTPPATFATRYSQMMTAIDVAQPAGGVLIGVANVVTPANRQGPPPIPPTVPLANGVPYFSYGSTYYLLDQGGQIPGPFTAAASCAPPRGDSVLVPFPFGGALISGGATLNCTEPQTIQPAELTKLVSTVAAYNQTIQTAAAARGWLYVNPNPTLDSLRAIATEVAFFPNFGAPTPTACNANPFGLAFSCDAIHPSARTHKLLANKLIQGINLAYGTGITVIP
jgi:hypothetical protein